jgi:hypothetical protein
VTPEFVTVFEIGNRIPFLVLEFVISLVAVLVIVAALRGYSNSSEFERWVRIGIAGLAALVGFVVGPPGVTTFDRLLELDTRIDRGEAQVTTGTVTEFVPGRADGKRSESFVVNGHRFTYSEWIIEAGFNHTAGRGGPMREGLNVRITFVGDSIVKLELAQDP